MPAFSTQRATPAGSSSIATPSASSTSADPQADDAARLPCLHTFARAGDHERRDRRDVDRVAAIAAGAARVDDAVEVVERHVLARVLHGRQEPGHLLDGLALHAQPDDEPGDLRLRRLAREDLGHRRRGLLGGQVVTGRQRPEHARPPAQIGKVKRCGGAGARCAGVPFRYILPTPRRAHGIRARAPGTIGVRSTRGTRSWPPRFLLRTRDRRSRDRDHGRRPGDATTNSSGGTHSLSASRYGLDTTPKGSNPPVRGDECRDGLGRKSRVNAGQAVSGELRPGLHQQLLHQVSGIPPMPARRAHRRQATLARPIRDGALRHLEQQGDFARAQQASGQHLGRGVGAEQLGDQMLPFMLLSRLRPCSSVPPNLLRRALCVLRAPTASVHQASDLSNRECQPRRSASSDCLLVSASSVAYA